MSFGKLAQVAVAAVAVLARPCLSETPSAQVATLSSGKVAGTIAHGVAVWRGIPYAAPPVGALRWRPPQPVARWRGVRQARDFAASCPQVKESPTQFSPIGTMSEDCLYLNIWSPVARSARRPVMVWLHGGGFIAGAGSEAQFDGTALAKKGVLLVTVNYRLGRLGFFAHPALSAEHPEEPQGNYGLMDQIAALKWVHDNIAAFGGDPGNVTLFGESAGAGSTLLLSTSPLANGLFHKMIVESAPINWVLRDIHQTRAGIPSAEAIGSRWAQSMGVAGEDNAALGALRALPVDRIAPSAPDVATVMAQIAEGGPMIDGKLLPDTPLAIYARGRQHAVPMILGTNTQESVVWSFEAGRPGLTPIAPTKSERILARIPQGLARDSARAAYLHEADGDAAKADGMLRADAFMGAAAFGLAATASQNAPTWLYRFDTAPAQARTVIAGAPHGTEIFYVFGTLDRFPVKAGHASAEDRRLSQALIEYWTSFAASGKPIARGAPVWPAFDPARPSALKVRNGGIAYAPLHNAATLAILAGDQM